MDSEFFQDSEMICEIPDVTRHTGYSEQFRNYQLFQAYDLDTHP
jgi:hypothetical protein